VNPGLCHFFDPESGESLLRRDAVPQAELPRQIADPVG
jgi:hypothetical protein